MKNNKKRNIVWIAALAALVILLLLLSMCTGRRAETASEAEAIAETAAQLTAAPKETTEPAEQTEETTAPTEPTMETTAPTEAEKESDSSGNSGSSGGNSKPGGSGGYDPDPDDDEDEDEEEEEKQEEEKVEIPEPGTKTNPYVEMLSAYPASVTSVSIPAGKTVEYLIYGSAGTILTIEDPDAAITLGETSCKADESGIVKLDLSKATEDAVISFANTGSAAAAYTVNIMEPLGGKTNPEEITDITRIPVKLEAEDAGGYHYLWKAGVSGELTLTSELEGLEIVVTRGEDGWKLSESKDGKLTLRAAEADELLIQVLSKPGEDGKRPALEGAIAGQWMPDPGTKENPHSITLEQIPGGFKTVEIPAGESVWYSITNAGGTVLTMEDPAVRLTYNDTVLELSAPEEPAEEDTTDSTEATEATTETEPEGTEPEETKPEEPPEEETKVLSLELAPTEEGQPVLLLLTNIGREPGTYTLSFAYPVGAKENPRILESIESMEAELKTGDLDGYHFSWTAPMDGNLTITADANACEITLIDAASGTQTHGENGTASADVAMNRTVLIRVMARKQEDGTYPAVKATLQGVFAPAPGTSAENPLVITDPLTPTGISFSTGETVYLSGMFHEMIATVQNASGVVAACGEETVRAARSGLLTMIFPKQTGEAAAPVLMAITSEAEQESVLTFAYPVGHPRNPAALILGDNRAELEENNTDGYHFTWTAECDGFLTIAPGKEENWRYSVENVTAGTEALSVVSGTENPETTVEVKQEEQLRIVLHTLDPKNAEQFPAGTVSITASFFDPLLGTEAKPMILDTTEETVNTLSVSAGETVYYSAQAEGMRLTLSGKDVTILLGESAYSAADGAAELICQDADSVFAVRNDKAEDQSFTIVFTYPLGHRENPIWLQAADQVTVPAEKTMYCTAKADGMVMTLTGTAVTVAHNGVEYTPEEGSVQIPCQGASTFEPPVFAITNTADAEAVYEVSFAYPIGHFMNPVQLQLGENSAVPDADNSAGVYFQWIPEEDGSLTITMEDKPGWQYVINNLTTGVNGDIRCSDDGSEAYFQTVEVTAGDEIQLILHAHDMEEGGTVGFLAEFTAMEPEETEPETVPGDTSPEATTE
nr:hypothetical protein [Oscillospiraceae bacterium]